MSSVIALLVGVSAYHPESGVSGLNGCLNDVNAMRDYILSRHPASPANVRTLTNSEATREAVITAFREHLIHNTAISGGDTVLFYYSGHGSYAPSAPEFVALNEDSQRLDETLVLYDSRLPGGFDLADKELALLLSLVPEKAHAVVVLDSCHSGSATRSLKTIQHSGLARFTSTAETPRKLDDYLSADTLSYASLHAAGKLAIPASRHLLLAACGRHELAYEDITARGVFSGWLTRLLQEAPGGKTYAQLYESLYAVIKKKSNQQTPQLKIYGGFNPDQFFLRPDANPNAPLLLAKFSENEWTINAGALHGIPATEKDYAKCQVLLYKNPEQDQPDITATITHVGLTDSIIRMPEGSDGSIRYSASLINLPPKLCILIEGPEANTVQPLLPGDPSIYYHQDPGQHFDYRLGTSDNQLTIRTAHNNELVHGVEGTTEAACHYIGEALSQIGKWKALDEMDNPQSKIPADNFEFGLQLMNENGQWEDCEGHEVTVDINDDRSEIPFRIKLNNTSQVEYHVALYHLSSKYAIEKQTPDTDASVLRKDQPIALLCNPPGDYLTFMLTDDDVNEESEVFKLVYSLFPFADYFVEESRELEREIVHLSKGIGSARGTKKPTRKDWDAQSIRVRIVRSNQQVDKSHRFDNGSISIGTATGFTAQVALTPTHSGAKGLNPAQELQSLFAGEEFSFLPVTPPSRGLPVNTVVELTKVKDDGTLADHPLEIRIRQPLQPNEAVIAVTMQNGIVIPLGFLEPDANGEHKMYIHHAPSEPDERRAAGKSLGRALWFSFLKVVFGKEEEVFKLRYLEYTDGEPVYSKGKVDKKIAQSKKILLVIHGIIGNTKSLSANLGSLLTSKQYDCILTFDYENLNTSIEEIAVELLDLLQQNGISPTKQIDILAHSMGGLVSRHMIERLHGDTFVKRLIMAGTPNNGSAFGKIVTVRNWATGILTLACNYGRQFLGTWGPFLDVVNKGLAATGVITHTLGQMNTGSKFLVQLNKYSGPITTRYYILAGDSDKYKLEAEDTGLMEKIELAVGKLLYWNTSNDIAVSVESIKTVPAEYLEASTVTGAHHLNYFDYNTSIKLLKDMMV